MPADLHCHSVCSDGFNTPAQVADFAARAGLTHVALSDHDTLSGVATFAREAAARGLVAIPAVECTCTDAQRDRPVHLLCYAPRDAAALQTFLNPTLARRREAKLAMADLIARRYPLTREDVLAASAQSASIHEVHLIAPLAAMGYTATVCGALLKELIGVGGSCYVPIVYPEVHEALAAIHAAGGLAVLAHPGQFDSLALAQELAQAGLLNGVECFHPRNSEAVTAQSLALCRAQGLLVTGGSDFHGMYANHPNPIGTCRTPDAELAALLAAAGLAPR